MFCNKCGNEMQDGTKFCNTCGANQHGEATVAQPAYRAPNYEMQTVRCYPDDATEARFRKFYEACGWTITDMDRRQVFDGQEESKDGAVTNNYSTQTHIKMQRDRNHPNYRKIKELSDKLEEHFKKNYSLREEINAHVALWILLGFSFLPVLGWFIAFAQISGTRKRNETIRLYNDKKRAEYETDKKEDAAMFAECAKLI